MDLSDVDTSWLGEFDNLESLQFVECSGVDQALQEFNSVPQLKDLMLVSADATATGITILDGSRTVTVLHLQEMHVDREILTIVSSLPNLRYLSLRGSQHEPGDLELLSKHSRLTIEDATNIPASAEKDETASP